MGRLGLIAMTIVLTTDVGCITNTLDRRRAMFGVRLSTNAVQVPQHV